MTDKLSLIIWIINSILLAKYYAAFLTPKIGKIPGNLVFTVFGGVYFIAQYAVDILLDGTPFHVATLGGALILFVFIFILSFILFKSNFRLCIFLLFSFFASQEICQFIMLSLSNILGNAHRFLFDYLIIDASVLKTAEDMISFSNNLLIIQFVIITIVYASIIILTLRIIKKSFIYKNHTLSSSELSYLILPCFSGISTTYIMRAIIVQTNDYGILMVFNDVPLIDLLVPLAGFIILFSMVATVKFFQKLIELHNSERERAVLHNQMQQMQEQIRDVDSIYTEIRGMRHDMKSHLSNIKILVKSIVEGNQDVSKELDEYLGKLGDTLNKFEFTYQTGNPISDVIIHQKYLEAVNNGISFSSDFIYPAGLDLDAYDLAVILNNALENAIEACNCMTESSRYIRVRSYTKGEIFFIEVENSFSNHFTIDEYTLLPVSKKSDKTAHGIGLSNIQRCARKYFGDIDFQVSEAKDYSIFRLTVMLQSRS